MAEKRELQESLLAIQEALKAPKSQYNSFGKYKYRSAEDILEAVKPLLVEQNVTLVLSDDILAIGNRIYLKATATIYRGEETISNCGFAREDETKKGMDGSQITGTASSYARKYALNGLFLIDDTKDADTDEYHNVTNQPKAQPKPQPAPAIFHEVDDDAMMKAEQEAYACQTSAELTVLWRKYQNSNPAYVKNGSLFFKAVQQRGGELKAEGK